MSSASIEGFILTRNWRDTSSGTELEYWLATACGPLKVVRTAQTCVAFIEARHRAVLQGLLLGASDISLRELPLKSFQHQPVLGIYSSQFRHIKRLSRALQPHGIALLEADVRPHERYLMERFITAGVQVRGGHMSQGVCTNGQLVPAPDFRPALKVVALDIETSQDQALYSIALDAANARVVMMLGQPPAQASPAQDFTLHYYPSRKAMIAALNDWFALHDPDVIIGWNVVQFDLHVLQKNADAAGMPLLLGRERQPIAWRTHPGKQEYLFAPMPGRVTIDGIEALRAAMWSFASFSLEHVAQQLLGEGKSIDSAYDKMAEIERRYQHDKPALAAYNMRDCELVLRIFEATKLLSFAMERAHTTGLQLDHFGGSIAAFSHHYLPRMHRLGYVAPNVGDVQGMSSPGGYVMDSQPGFYDSVLVLDYKSLYPSIIRTYLVDPVGLVAGAHEDADQRPIDGPLDTYFSRTQHCLPGIVTHLWKARDAAKRSHNEPLSQALKLVMNSFAGVLGASECRFFNPQLISAITLRGHAMVKATRDFVEQRGYRAIYGDTDSIFIWLRRTHTNAQAHAVAAELVRDINAWWKDRLQQEHGLESFLEIEFDTHYKKFFMPTIRGSDVGSKKRYAGLSVDAQGHESMVFRGLEMARSDWTPLARQFQEGLLSRVFQGTPYRDYIQQYVQDTLSGRKDDLLVYRKRLRHPLDAYVRNVPPQVRAARTADAFNLRMSRPTQYQNGGWIQYVITHSGPEPLEVRVAPIDYAHYVSKQLQPVADAILQPLGESFTQLISPQHSLF